MKPLVNKPISAFLSMSTSKYKQEISTIYKNIDLSVGYNRNFSFAEVTFKRIKSEFIDNFVIDAIEMGYLVCKPSNSSKLLIYENRLKFPYLCNDIGLIKLKSGEVDISKFKSTNSKFKMEKSYGTGITPTINYDFYDTTSFKFLRVTTFVYTENRFRAIPKPWYWNIFIQLEDLSQLNKITKFSIKKSFDAIIENIQSNHETKSYPRKGWIMVKKVSGEDKDKILKLFSEIGINIYLK